MALISYRKQGFTRAKLPPPPKMMIFRLSYALACAEFYARELYHTDRIGIKNQERYFEKALPLLLRTYDGRTKRKSRQSACEKKSISVREREHAILGTRNTKGMCVRELIAA